MYGSLSMQSAPKYSVAKSQNHSFELRPYQQDAVDRVIQDFESHRKLGVILPTGAGKTEIMLAVSSRFISEYGGRVLILSHMGLLVGQTSERSALRFPELKVGWLKAGHKPVATDDVIVGTMQSARVADKLSHIKDIRLIIVDEAHFITAQSYLDIIETYPRAKIMGLTATPFKSKRLMTNHFEKVSYCAALQDMIDQGYLLPPRLIGIEQQHEDVSTDVCALYKLREMGKKALVFMATVEEATLMSKVFQMEGVKAGTIVGETPESKRKQLIRDFQEGDVDVLCTVDVLTAGFDAPCVESIIMPVRCGSPATFMQRVGRGLRKYKDKTECRVYFFGKVPALEKKFYEAMAEKTFKAKPEKMDIFDQLEWAKFEDDQERITYCENMAKIHSDLKKRGYDWLAECIRFEKLGKDLLGRIDVLHDKLSGVSVKATNIPASAKQVAYLEGLTGGKVLDDLKTGEANALISALVGMKNPTHPAYGEHWNVPTGNHAGKHIKDLPWRYVSWCLANSPTGHVSKLFHKWNSFKKEHPYVK